jgi:hypothetical protein
VTRLAFSFDHSTYTREGKYLRALEVRVAIWVLLLIGEKNGSLQIRSISSRLEVLEVSCELS